MFVSTVLPSTMFNPTKNLNMSPYNFSVPYNFVRGRNIIININPQIYSITSPYTYNSLTNSYTGGTPLNRMNVVIPDNVTEYSVTMDFALYTIIATSNVPTLKYTVQIKFDITKGIITFTPTAVSPITGSIIPQLDAIETTPVLLTISTVL